MDIAIRVKIVRGFAVKNMISLLRDSSILLENSLPGDNCEVLYAAAWIIGEFSSLIQSEDYKSVIESLLQPGITTLPSHIQAVSIQSLLKIFAVITSNSSPIISSTNLLGETQEVPNNSLTENINNTIIDYTVKLMKEKLPIFTQSQYLEVQERACFVTEVLNLYCELGNASLAKDIAALFEEPLNPVAPKAQKKVPIPDDLNLDEWINEPEAETTDFSGAGFETGFEFLSKEIEESDSDSDTSQKKEKEKQPSTAQRYASSAYYLTGEIKKLSRDSENDLPPIVNLNKEDLGVKVYSYKNVIQRGQKSTKKKEKKITPEVIREEEMPEGAVESDHEEDKNREVTLENINLDAPLQPHEKLYVPTHRVPKITEPLKKEIKEEKKKIETSKKSSKYHSEKKNRDSKHKKKNNKKEKDSKKKDGTLIDLDSITSSSSATTSHKKLNNPTQISKEHHKPKKEKKINEEKQHQSKKKLSEPKNSTNIQLINKPKNKLLCQDENLTIFYETKVNPKEPKKIMASFTLKNISQKEITDIEFDIPATLNSKMASESFSKINIHLLSGESNIHNIIFNILSIQQPIKLQGNILYKIEELSKKKDFQLVFPVSAFIIPIKVEKEQFVSILTEGGPFTLSSTDIKTEEDFKQFIISLAMLLRVELIILDTGASFYGKTIQNHHIAIHAKPNSTKSGVIHIDIKSSDPIIGNSLVNEINKSFSKT
jgi:AP-3 complex subunit delta-1